VVDEAAAEEDAKLAADDEEPMAGPEEDELPLLLLNEDECFMA
jgi:hypothetical protein